MIDRAYIEIDGGYGDEPPYQTKAFLKFEGNFDIEISQYMFRADSRQPLTIEITQSAAEELLNSLVETFSA